MPKYLWQVSYSQHAVKGLLDEGGTARREATAAVLKDVGGSLEAFYFAFGETDVYVIATLPDDATAAAVSLTVGAAGTGSIRTTR
ncbi:MAG: GYD domain-containing protein, partial [Acidimicrobiia bacterium]